MQWSDIPVNPPVRTLRQFAGMCIIFFGALAAWNSFRNNPVYSITFLTAAGIIGPLGLIRPRAIRPLYVGWLVLVFPIGWLISNLILTCLFYGVITPIGTAFKLAGRDVLHRRRQPDRKTHWTLKPMASDMRSYLRQF